MKKLLPLLLLVIIPLIWLHPSRSIAISTFSKSSQNPIITTNPGSWESLYVHAPSILLDGSTLKMWYAGHNGSTWKVGYATSSDGINWTKYASNPVFSSNPSDPNDNHTHTPRVIKDGDTYKMWYTASPDDASNFTIRYATSNDGVNWTRQGVINLPSQNWDLGSRVYPFVLKVGSEYKLWYSSAAGTGSWKIGLATSTDGINWTPNAGNPVLTPTQSWEGSDVDGASVLYDGTTYEIFYHGSGNLSYATSTNGINWTKPADKNPILTRGASFDNNSMAGAGAIRLSNGTTLLYYGANGNVSGSTTWRIGLASDGPIVLPTPTPTPTPTPAVVIIPGMFASWNKEAILENKAVSQSEWKINSIVREYDGLKETLKGMGFVENTSLFLYAYDWRKKLDDAATELNTYITSKIPGSTKVDLVGYSLGGLVGRIYGQKYGTSRIDKLITVGSPHQGVPQAYKAYAGGEIDRENTLQWLALKLILILNRAAGKTDRQVVADWTPVARDLVPIYTFLTRSNDGSTVDPTAMTYKNDTLLTYAAGFNGLFPLFQSIAGESAQTLSGFTVTSPTASDVANNIYPDGRPAAETKAIGDSTVVSQSAKADSDVKVLVLGHGELIYKRNGIKEVISSLGYSVADSAITEGRPTGFSPSLIFLIKSPATMAVEYKGKTYPESDGMIFLENAESGTYTLKVTGTGKGKYTIVVGQITTDNDYWDTIEDEITKDPPSSQTDYYTIDYPSNPLTPTGSKSGTGGGPSSPTSNGTATLAPSPTPSPSRGIVPTIAKLFTDIAETLGVATPAAEPIYQIPQPKHPLTFMWWFVGSGLFLLLLAWFLRRYSKR